MQTFNLLPFIDLDNTASAMIFASSADISTEEWLDLIEVSNEYKMIISHNPVEM